MRRGVRLGVDVGTTRIGVARSDADGMMAVPVETVLRGDGDIAALRSHADSFGAVEIVVGLPVALSGRETASTADARAFASKIAEALPAVPVRLVDERLSTVSAQQALRTAGRSSRRSRQVIDQVAAVIILQHALDAERTSGSPPGALVVTDPPGSVPIAPDEGADRGR
jgi:putative holliday junction resolvase